jgi:protein-S-isoprenylcysteine O-methyltransferase Ste14
MRPWHTAISRIMIVKAVAQTIVVLALLAALLFGLAGTLHWFGAYVLLAALGIGGLTMTTWLARRDPALLKDRIGSPRQKKPTFDRILLPLMNLFLSGWIGAMALEVRWHGTSQLPAWANVTAGLAILICFFLVVCVLRENTFATAVVKSQRGQKVICSGPYAVVRHPMYSAAVLAYAAIPIALGSKAGIFGAPIAMLLLAVRILFEERLLRRELPGYCDYMTNVRYRLVPFIW